MKRMRFEKSRSQLLRIAIAASALLLTACASVPAALAESWTLANEYPATSLSGESDALFARLVAQRTGGTLTIVVAPDAKLGYKSREQLAAVAADKVTMASSFAGALAGEDALFGLSSLPFVATSLVEARALFDLARPLYEAAFARHQQILLYATPWPPSGLWAKTPATSLEIIAKMRLRAYDKLSAEVFARLGAKSKVVSFADLAPLLTSGDIDAVLSSGDGGAGRKLWTHLPHFTEIGYALPLSFTTVNRARWEALTPALREQVLAAAAETQADVWHALEGREKKNHSRMRDNGMTITSPIPYALREPLRAAGESTVDDWATQAGPEAADVLRKFRAMDAATPSIRN